MTLTNGRRPSDVATLVPVVSRVSGLAHVADGLGEVVVSCRKGVLGTGRPNEEGEADGSTWMASWLSRRCVMSLYVCCRAARTFAGSLRTVGQKRAGEARWGGDIAVVLFVGMSEQAAS